MRRVWVVIPLVLVVSMIGIVGMQESFATIKSSQNYSENWYLGEGLKEGDYFEYFLCHTDYNDCAPIKLKMWIKGTIPYESGTLWDAKVAIFDGNKIIIGSMGLGKIAPEPVIFDDNIFEYAIMFKTSVTWLSVFATASEGIHGPKEFKSSSWGNIGGWGIGGIGGPFPLRAETISIPAGTFDTVVVGWNTNEFSYKDAEFWIVDDFPFPVKAILHELSSVDTSENLMYEFELLDYQENVLDDPFVPVYVPESFEEENTSIPPLTRGAPGLTLRITDSHGNSLDHLFVNEKVWIDYDIANRYDEKQILSYHLDITNPQNEIIYAESFLIPLLHYQIFDEDISWIPEDLGEYTITAKVFTNATNSEFFLPPVSTTIKVFLNQESFTEKSQLYFSPKKQLELGIAPENVICNDGLELIFKQDNSPACVTPSTAEKLIQRGWTS